MYNPCFECSIKYGKSYINMCDDTCDYAKAIKTYTESLRNKDTRIKELEAKLDYTNEMLSKAYQIIGEVIER